MIRSHEDRGGSPPGFGTPALMRSLEPLLAAKQGRPSDAAQQLFYDAREAATDEGEFERLQQALKLDPGNVGALPAVLRHRPVAPEDEIERP
jgi:hypothetical protein